MKQTDDPAKSFAAYDGEVDVHDIQAEVQLVKLPGTEKSLKILQEWRRTTNPLDTHNRLPLCSTEGTPSRASFARTGFPAMVEAA